MKKIRTAVLVLLCMTLVSGCSRAKEEKTKEKNAEPLVIEEQTEEKNTQEQITEPAEERTEEKQEDPQVEDSEKPTVNGHIVAIDPGHQAAGNPEQEPIGPGASETKAKVASGTSGTATGVNEYELTLSVSLKLQQELKQRGYQVVMIRTGNEVDLSNAERAQTANASGAEAFVRIHANGSEDPSVQGALTMCMTPENPYNGTLYGESRRLSDLVLDGLCTATGAVKNSVIETDTMSGINWCTIPVTIVEMGFMTNPEEDIRMETEEYQVQTAKGIADGIDEYFS